MLSIIAYTVYICVTNPVTLTFLSTLHVFLFKKAQEQFSLHFPLFTAHLMCHLLLCEENDSYLDDEMSVYGMYTKTE